MEDPHELYRWLDRVISDAIQVRGLDDATIAYTLLSRGTRYLRTAYKLRLDEDFLCWLEETIRDARKKLNITDRTMVDILVAKGLHYLLRAVARSRIQATQDENSGHRKGSPPPTKISGSSSS